MNKKFIQAICIGLFCVTAFVGCKNDPYPDGLAFEPTGDGAGETGERQDPTLFLQAQSVMQFVEGDEGIYEIRGVTPSGSSRIEVYDLPRGAEFNPETGEVKWTPDFFAANDPQDDEVFHREYPVKVHLFDATNNLIFMEQEVVLLVYDSPRDMLIWTDANSVLSEGREFFQNIEVLDEDFPGDAINLYSPDLPRGALLENRGNGRFRIRFTADFDFTKQNASSDAQGRYRDINFRLQAIGPRSHVTTKIVQWRVRDVNKRVNVRSPSQVQATSVVKFTMTAIDRNMEVAPRIRSLDSPLDGNFRLNRISQSTNGVMSSQYEVEWTDVPVDRMGTTVPLRFSACGHNRRSESCREFTVSVQFAPQPRRAPQFDRGSWQFGEVKEIVVGENLQVSLPIRDLDARRSVADVEIQVSDAALEVEWRNSRLTVKSQTPGLYQFTIKATTIYGVEGKESMIVRIVEPAPPTPPTPPAIPERLLNAPLTIDGEDE